jgi:hypothetical protein
VPSVTLLNLTTIDRQMQNAYSRQANAEIERQVGEHATLSVGYQYSRGDHLIIQVNQNVPTCVPAGTNNGCRPVPSYANNNRYSPLAHSTYHALNVAFVQRPARVGSYRISYSLSKAMNDVGENFFSSPIDPTDISKDWGRSDDDQRHRLVLSGSLNLPGAFQLSGLLQSYSHLPLNITSGVTTLQGTAGRPLVNGAFIGRNTGQGRDFFATGLRVSRVFAIGRGVTAEGMAEAFNLTNRANALTMNANFGAGAYPSSPAPAFGQVTAVGEPRSIQLALRLRF